MEQYLEIAIVSAEFGGCRKVTMRGSGQESDVPRPRSLHATDQSVAALGIQPACLFAFVEIPFLAHILFREIVARLTVEWHFAVREHFVVQVVLRSGRRLHVQTSGGFGTFSSTSLMTDIGPKLRTGRHYGIRDRSRAYSLWHVDG